MVVELKKISSGGKIRGPYETCWNQTEVGGPFLDFLCFTYFFIKEAQIERVAIMYFHLQGRKINLVILP